MKFMKYSTRALSAGLLALCAASAYGLSADEKMRLEILRGLSLEDLQEVELRLDDAFDVFEGIVRLQNVSVATGVKQSKALAPSVTTVITAQDIEAMGARTLDEALRSVPGVNVSYNWINMPMYTLRGMSSGSYTDAEVLVLINGIRTNTSSTGDKGGFYWHGLPVSAISRVEIIRGPGSAVYGADAFAGVINIVTKSALDIDGTEAGVRLGSFNTQDAWITHGSRWNDFKIAAMLDFGNTDGHRRTVDADAQTALDQVFGTHASLAPGPYGSEITSYDARVEIAKQQWRLRAGISHSEDMGNGVGFAQALDPSQPVHNEIINADLTWSEPALTDNWGVEAQLSHLHLDWGAEHQIFPPGAFGGAYPIGYLGYPYVSETETQLALSGVYRGFDRHVIRLGAGYVHSDMYQVRHIANYGLNPFTGEMISPLELVDLSDTPMAYVPEVDRKDVYGFVQDIWTFQPGWELTSSLRYDQYSDFGTTLNPRLGLVWEPRAGLVAKLLYGRAFRAPPFIEKYNRNNPISLGNPDLQAEKIDTVELAFDWRANDNLHLALNLFRYKIEDKITLLPESTAAFRYANAADWEGRGGEFELRWKTSNKSSLLFNYSFQSAKDSVLAILSSAPQQSAYLRGDYLIGSRWFVDAQINWNDGWARADNDPRPALDGYTTVDLTLRRKEIRDGRANFAFGVRNLFDADVRYPTPGPDSKGVINLPNDLPGAGRSYFVEYRYKFK